MKWFRWYHGSITDPKFKVAARKANQSLTAVMCIWAAVLERSSQSSQRGCIEGFDPESMDVHFDLEDGATQAILDAFEAKGLLLEGCVVNWDSRQPKREREDNSTERSRKSRERKKQAEKLAAEEARKQAEQADKSAECNADTEPCNDMQHHATPSNALDKTRLEETRLEKNLSTSSEVDSSATPVADPPQSDQIKPPSVPQCPHEAIIALYHELCPTSPQIRKWGDANKRALRARWREAKEHQSLDFWRWYFGQVSRSDFLSGRIPGRNGPFTASLAWLIKPTNFEKVINGQYENRDAVQVNQPRATTQAQANQQNTNKFARLLNATGGASNADGSQRCLEGTCSP